MAQIQQLFEDSGDAVFAIDKGRRVSYTNAAFRQVMGKDAAEMCGRPCYEVLCADDLSSRRFCSRNCPIAREALQSQPMPHFDLILTRRSGDRCWVNIGVYSIPGDVSDSHEPQVYFALRTVNGHRLIHQMASDLHKPSAASRHTLLSRREREILALTVHGQDTVGISRDLSISPQTVRNHFKNIFTKLEVRSRSQAVALALRQQLI